MAEDSELQRLRREAREDRKLMRRSEEALAEIDRGPGLSDAQADVLAALRIRLEGRRRASLDDLLSAAGDAGGRKGLDDALTQGEGAEREWPDVQEKKRDWPGL